MSYYSDYGEEAVSTFIEERESLEDALDEVQEERDEYLRVLTQCFWAFHDSNQIDANRFWWSEPTLQAEISANCFKEEPGECVSETARTIDGKKPKSFCQLWERWTNCREVGHCVKAAANE